MLPICRDRARGRGRCLWLAIREHLQRLSRGINLQVVGRSPWSRGSRGELISGQRQSTLRRRWVLKTGFDAEPLRSVSEAVLSLDHENVRGPDYYN